MVSKQRQKSPFFLSGFLVVATVFFQVGTLLLSATVVPAETRYVKPSGEIVVRRGQGNEYKIIAMAKGGSKVELLEEGENHTRIRLENGKEGWITKRFLSTEPPLDKLVASLRIEKEASIQKETTLTRELEITSETLSRTELELGSALAKNEALNADYLKLQNDTADVVGIKTDSQKATQENTVLSETLATLQKENDSIKNDSAIKWFMAGGGVLLVGMVLGNISGRARRKRTTFLK